MQSSLVVRTIPDMGRGVFAARPFRAGEVVEVCPVIVLATGEGAAGTLADYVFCWGDDGRLAVALGHGSLYNHSATPNAAFDADFDRREVVFRAARAIEAGEQIFIDYEWDDYSAFDPTAVSDERFAAHELCPAGGTNY